MPDSTNTDPTRWVDDHGDVLYRFALARVRRPEVAEDLVQDALLAAVRSQERFAGQSSERTWLVGILKNKILDYFRKIGRETTFTDMDFLNDEMQSKFEDQGWDFSQAPQKWCERPDEAAKDSEFWGVLKGCLDRLPARVASVFSLREMDDIPGREICKMLDITESNLWVMLHRARMALRECLEIHWFGTSARQDPGGTTTH